MPVRNIMGWVYPVEEFLTVTIDTIIYLGQQGMLVTLYAALPLLLSGMIVGLIISIFQSVTQIQEITLTFVPKIIIVFIAFVFFLPFMSEIVLTFVRELFMNMDNLTGPP